MNVENFISTTRFCDYHKVESHFIDSLSEFGLITLVSIEEVHYIPLDQVPKIEKIIRLHYDLDINIEGIEAISHLLQRINNLQQEMGRLRNRLDFYER